MDEQKYRSVTSSDLDGLVCALRLRKVGIVGDVLFLPPRGG